jgi:hypothetical protein
MKDQAGWYHDSEFDTTHEIKFFADSPDVKPANNWYGPFKTFGDCKRDAIEYHQTDIHKARAAIADIRAMRRTK